jgi:hypothetical protein
MTQINNSPDNDDTGSVASNLTAVVGSGETTILDKVSVFGFFNFGVTITCNSGTMSACALYGSADGTNYIAITGFTTFALTTGQTKHAEATGVWQYLRLTCTGVSNVDAHLNAILG